MPDLRDLDRLVELAAQHAHHILLELKEESLAPAFLFVTGGGEVHVTIVAGPDWDDKDIKDDVAAWMRVTMRAKGAVAYTYLSEAWMALLPAGAPPPVNVRDRPDRIEVVTCIAYDDKGNGRSKAWRMIRNKRGKLIELREDDPFGEGAKAGLTSGRFSHLLEGRA